MVATPSWKQHIIEEHYEELQLLWELRLVAVVARDYHERDLAELDERIDAHTDGLVLSRDHCVPLLQEGLAGPDRPAVFAAAYPLLCCFESQLTKRVCDAFAQAEGEALLGFRDAFCHSPTTQTSESLRRYAMDTTPVAAMAAEALAFHGKWNAQQSPHWKSFVDHEDPLVRASAWRQLAYGGTDVGRGG